MRWKVLVLDADTGEELAHFYCVTRADARRVCRRWRGDDSGRNLSSVLIDTGK